jgi:hypothetical protein
MITLEDLANPNMLDAFVIPEQEWAIMTPEQKAAILYPDVSTTPPTKEELEEIDISEEPTLGDLHNG